MSSLFLCLSPLILAVCLVMEYMGGGSLQHLIDVKYHVEEASVAVVAYSVLRALEELHSRNIIHRDVKVQCSAV